MPSNKIYLTMYFVCLIAFYNRLNIFEPHVSHIFSTLNYQESKSFCIISHLKSIIFNQQHSKSEIIEHCGYTPEHQLNIHIINIEQTIRLKTFNSVFLKPNPQANGTEENTIFIKYIQHFMDISVRGLSISEPFWNN